MFIWRKSKISFKFLATLFVLLIASTFLVEALGAREVQEEYEKQIEAATLMAECLKEVALLREELRIPFNSEKDPNYTGIIGEAFTEITTTDGNEIAKRTSTNPAFAALMVKYFTELGLRSGDAVAIGSSGSFPALLLATLCACEVLDLVPYATYSFGASMYGATLPDMTFWHMLERFKEKDLLPYSLVAVSMGGTNDQGEDDAFSFFFDEGVKEQVLRRLCEESGVLFIDIPDMAENIRYRLELYDELSKGNPTKCFVNVGGATPNYGGISASNTLPNGIVRSFQSIPISSIRGLTFEYLARGVPIINLIDIRNLATSNGIPIDPVPLPEVGDGGVYYKEAYPKTLIAAILALAILVLFFFAKKKDDAEKGPGKIE